MEDRPTAGGELIDFFSAVIERRGSKYTTALASEIVTTYLLSTKSLQTLCDEKGHWPHYITIFKWRLLHAEFGQAMELARQMRGDALLDQCIEIADDTSNDIVGGEPNPVAVGRSKVRIETRVKWVQLVCPEKYGQRSEGYRPPGYLPQEEAIRLLK